MAEEAGKSLGSHFASGIPFNLPIFTLIIGLTLTYCDQALQQKLGDQGFTKGRGKLSIINRFSRLYLSEELAFPFHRL